MPEAETHFCPLRLRAAIEARLPAGAALGPADGPLLEHLPIIEARLSGLLAETDPFAVDLAVLRLRNALAKAEALAEGRARAGFDAADLGFAPLLWQLHALDLHAEAWLLAGLPRLEGWTARLIAHPALAGALAKGADRLWLQELRRKGAQIAGPLPAAIERISASAGAAALR